MSPDNQPGKMKSVYIDVINASAIRVAGIGGLGLVVMAFAVAWTFPRIGQTMILGMVLGTVGAVALILRRRRMGPMPSSGRRSGANITLQIDATPDSDTNQSNRHLDRTMVDIRPSEQAV